MDSLKSNAENDMLLTAGSEIMPYEKMEEDLTCPVCLELYADPLMMPCSHSICKACLRDIMKSRERSGKQDLECPACRETHHFSMNKVNLLPKNLALENIVFRYQEIRSISLSRAAQLASPLPTSQLQVDVSNSPACSPCHDTSVKEQDSVFDESVEERFPCGMCEEAEKNEAEWFCPQCQVLYCQHCLHTFHPKRGSLLKHKVRRPMNIEDSGNFLFCHDHSNEKASIFCDTCKIVACHLCVCVGHGAHCSHTIIDLDTAKKQLQETVEFAQEKLSALLTSFSERETDMDTHLQNSKTLEENAQNAIISQYNCIMSDITDSLNIAKKKSLDAIAALGSSHSTHLSSGSRHIKALLSHCEDLNEACKGFLEMEDDGSFSSDSQSANSSFSSSVGNCKEQNIQFSKHQKSSMVSSRHLSEGSALAKMHSRNVKKTPNRHSSDGSSLSCSPICGGNRHPPHFLAPARRPSHSEVKLSEVHSNSFGFDAPVTESKSSQNFEPSAEDGSTVSRKSASINMKGKASSAILELDATDNSEATKESNSGKSHSDLNKPSNLRQNCKSLIQSKSCTQSQITGKKHHSLNGKDESSNYGRCMPETNFPHQNLSTPQSESQVSAAELTKKSLIPGRREDVPNQKEEDIVYSEGQDMVQFGSNFKRKNQLLLRADEVGPVLEQVSALSKQVEQERSNRKKSLDAKIKDFNQNIDLSVSSFHSSTLHLINNMTAHITAECPVIIPSVRSISVSSPHQELSTPRVQSRVLMTWGFNSTTFIADPISSSAQWTVNIIRNTSHIGDVKSGYLFGVGIALNTLNSKDQVGISSNSHAIVCINGDLAVCHDKQLSPIMPLSDLPMSVTISVNQNLGKYLYMTYKIRVNGLSKCLQGRRVVSLPPDSQKNPKPAASNAADTKDKDHQKYAGSVTFSTPVGNHESDTAGSDQESKLISQVDKSLSQDEPSLCLFSIFPVFTVSQRVKMQFPQTSEV